MTTSSASEIWGKGRARWDEGAVMESQEGLARLARAAWSVPGGLAA